MPLNKIILKSDIKTLLNSLKSSENQEQSIEDFGDGLADIIDAYIKTATVNVTTTIVGTSPSGAVTGTGTGTGTLS